MRQRESPRRAVHRFGKRGKSFLWVDRGMENESAPRSSAGMRGQRKRGTMYRAPTEAFASAAELESFFFGHVNDHLGGDVTEDFDGDGIFAEGFDGIGELDLALVDLEGLRGETFGDVGGGDGAEHLIV